MSLRKIVPVVLFGLVSAGPALANHEGPGSLDLFVRSAQYLNQLVASSTLRFPVKSAVYRFVVDAEALDRCADTAPPSDAAENNPTDNHTGGVPEFCRAQLYHTFDEFQPVDRYLYDAYDYPAVYQAYLNTRSALFALRF